MIDIKQENFDSEVLKSSLPVVVDFWAPWCGPCRIFSPIIDEVSKEMEGKVKFAKLNTDENQEIAQKYNIMSIPTVLIFEKGTVKATSVGALPKESFKSWLHKNV
ncbi:MAG TPA: thioredoxin [Candidatus Saccharimonadales bacterium]|nr:thioredoxin [Candidatus Saccharimonadales bacterium]